MRINICENLYNNFYGCIDRFTDKLSQIGFLGAAILTRPACKAHEIYSRVFMPIIPAKYSQQDTKVKEIAYRILLGQCFFPASVTAAVCGPFSLLTRFFANLILRTPFNYLRGNAIEKNFENKSFSIFSLNTCCIAGGFPLQSGVKLWRERINGIIKLIRDNNADVVCLQEVHDFQAALKLFDDLKDEYAHFYINIGSQTLGANSGLFVASKFKVKDQKFIPFDIKTLLGEIKFVRKGVFSFDLINNGQVFQVLTTHLQHSENDFAPTQEAKNCRKVQMDLLLKNQKKDIPTIIAGDLNMGKDEFDENEKLSEAFGSDILSKNVATHATSLKEFGWNLKSSPKKEEVLLDHILTNKDSFLGRPLIYTRLVPTYDFEKPDQAHSDHKGLLAIIV